MRRFIPRTSLARRNSWKSRTVLGGLAVAAVIGTTAGGPPADPDGERDTSGDRAGESRRIASSVLGRDYQFTLTAVRSTADPTAASVELRVFTFQDGEWKESDRATVGEPDGWFWGPLTGSGAICEFSTASTEPAPVAVSLLITPSAGCAPAEEFEVSEGQIVTG
ncbi:hypothetical protein [Streptomyces litchfieldiae]|uniref:Secreted protein n=1 Tax=Streptomyces litchfieldiae TaxID=3075543 RepID=A0ABU2MQE0_9ACTN|nr:hypothetical protein [Streptomyces sp. DSM 44938]MDT0343617.1 hypothetical protein [Streptomyces sp. DSM 44938]